MKAKGHRVRGDMRQEYVFDYSTAVRGKHYGRLPNDGTTVVVVLEPDVAKAFRDSKAVNEALRAQLQFSEATRRLTSRRAGRTPAVSSPRNPAKRRPTKRTS